MSEEANKQTQAITQAGGVAVEEALAMVRAAEMLEIPVETLLEGVYSHLFTTALNKSALGLKRMAAVCLILYAEKRQKEREGEVSDAD